MSADRPSDARYVWWLHELSKDDRAVAGGKGANLGELTRAGIAVPPAFVVGAGAYQEFLRVAGLGEAIRRMLEGLDPSHSGQLQTVAGRIQATVLDAALPAPIADAICDAYRRLARPLVAVRSSATAEDLAEASFAGQQSTFLNVEGEQAVLTAVQRCWASLFAPQALVYRARRGLDHLAVAMAAPVQAMVQSDVSGVLFTADPVSGDRAIVMIEAAFGLGEALVGGALTPDLYTVDKASLAITLKEVSRQDWKLARGCDATTGAFGNIEVPLAPGEGGRQKLSDSEIVELARLGLRIEAWYGTPQDIEWASEGGQLYVVQARPVTTL